MSGETTMPTEQECRKTVTNSGASLFDGILLRLVDRSFELCPQLGGCRPFPRSESSIKGIRILVAEQVRHLCDIDIRPVEILARQFLARPGDWPFVTQSCAGVS